MPEEAIESFAADGDGSADLFDESDDFGGDDGELSEFVESPRQVDGGKKDNQDGSPSVEDLAREMGWRPKSEFGKDRDKKEWVDAATFLRRGGEIQQSLRDQVKDLRGAVDAIRQHNETVYKAEVKRLEGDLAKLKENRRKAIEDGDVEAVDKLDEQLDTVKSQINNVNPATAQTGNTEPAEQITAWKVKNPWYDSDPEMGAYADSLAQRLDKSGKPVKEILDTVERSVRERFSDRFNGRPPARQRAAMVESGSRFHDGSRQFSGRDLTSEQRATMRQFVRLGVMTEKEYIRDLAKTGAI